MFQRPADDVADDFKIPVRMHAESLSALHLILIDHAQGAKTHERRIVVVCERERVVAFQPAMIGVTAFVGGTQRNHGPRVGIARLLPIGQRGYPCLSQMG